jgi:RHS repeat-associated protein
MVTNQTGNWSGPFGYAGGFGYQEDETGLRLLGHRYYDPSTGRFLTRDPIKDGRNWYLYCDNNPSKRVDANGLSWHDPMVVYVDPNFKGKVRVVGEPGLGLEQCYLDVPAGYHSDPSMDVDYIEITYPDGTQVVVFVYGTKNPFDDVDEPELTTIDANGKVHNPGGGALRSVGGDPYSSIWLFNGRSGFSKKAPSGLSAYKGKPKLGKPKKRTKKGLGRSSEKVKRGGIRPLGQNDFHQ